MDTQEILNELDESREEEDSEEEVMKDDESTESSSNDESQSDEEEEKGDGSGPGQVSCPKMSEVRVLYKMAEVRLL